MEKALHQETWFINGHYLSITKWKPNFVANKEKLTASAVWIRLPQLPTKFYNGKILEKIGIFIGRLLKIDVCTSTTMRGRYARLCMVLPLEFSEQLFIYIGNHKQYIHYEGESFLCKNCGRLRHTVGQCICIQKDIKESSYPGNEQPNTKAEDQEGEWKIVSFNKGKRQIPKNSLKNTNNPKEKYGGPGITIKLFNANMGKYENSQILQYKTKDPTQSFVSNVEKILASLAMSNTTVPVQKTFSLLDGKQMVLNKTTKNENKNITKISHAERHLDTQADDWIY